MVNPVNPIPQAAFDAHASQAVSDPDHARTLRLLKRKRVAVNGDLPTYDSLIGYSLFLLLCEYHVSGEAARLKDIYLELGRSQGGVRRILRRLVSDGWVEVSRSEGDQRNRLIAATPKLKRTFEQYLQTLHG